jgi:hypothetical protein
MLPIRRFSCHTFAGLSLLVLAGFAERATADAVPGVDWYVESAELLALVQAEGERNAEAFPPPRGQQRVIVREILIGFDTRQTWLVPAGTLKPGQEAILLKPYHTPSVYEAVLQTKRISDETKPVVWPVVNGKVLTNGVPATTSGRIADPQPVTLKVILDEVARTAPEEQGLYSYLLTAWLFPEKLEAVVGKDPERLAYVHFVATVRDLERDVLSLSQLLESPDRKVRDAAIRKLRAITRTPEAPPAGPLSESKDEKPASLHAWSQSWCSWWEKRRDELVWDRKESRWLPRAKSTPPARRWPEVPADFKRPGDDFPPELLRALEKKDVAAFSAVFQTWLDSGVVRDRQIKQAEVLAQELKQRGNLEGGTRFLPPSPRLRTEVVSGAKLSAADRAKIVALVAHQWHFDRFARERREAIGQIKAEPVGSELVRRAAFWEMRDTNVGTAGRGACVLLGASVAPADQKLLTALFLEGPDDTLINVGRDSVSGRHPVFTTALIDHLGRHNDRAAEWAARVLAQGHEAAALPVILEKLKDPDANVRRWAALALCWHPSATTVPGLLAAIKAEKDSGVRNEMLTALAQTGDERGLDALMEGTKGEFEKHHGIEFARGLARIKDKRALPALSAMVERHKDDPQYQCELVESFGWVSGLYKAFPPHKYWSGGANDPECLKTGLAEIAKWRAMQLK